MEEVGHLNSKLDDMTKSIHMLNFGTKKLDEILVAVKLSKA